jgi:hypothetical protein
MRGAVLLLLCVIGQVSGPTAFAQSGDASARPVTDVTERPTRSSIEFVAFEFQEPGIYHALSVEYRKIEGEPAAGAAYGVEAVVGGQEAIDTLLFEVIDAAGTVLQPIPIVHRSIGVPDDVEFIGMLTVPTHPFRVRVTGEDIYGRPFSLVLRRLFKPTLDRAAEDQVPPELGSEVLQVFRQMFADARAERQALAAENPGGRIVMPRTRISNVTYAPFVSSSDRVIGIRVTYDAEFSQAGRYNPKVRLYAEDREDYQPARFPLRPLKSSIQPVPRETYAPYKAAEDMLALLAQRADFLYEAGVRYRFSVDLVPSFVGLQRYGTAPCLAHETSHFESAAGKEAFARMLARVGPTTYRLSIGLTAFQGRIDGFPGEGTFYRSFMAEGVTECERFSEDGR